MPQFPQKEAGVIVLATKMIKGLDENGDIYPDAPVNPPELRDRLNTLTERHKDVNQAKSVLKKARADWREALALLAGDMKKDLRYAENLHGNDGASLQRIGWDKRHERTKAEKPGQPKQLAIVRQGRSGLAELRWKRADSGGMPRAYRVQRRVMKEGTAWLDVTLAMRQKITLQGQPTGTELEFRIISANHIGESTPSNVVRAVL